MGHDRIHPSANRSNGLIAVLADLQEMVRLMLYGNNQKRRHCPMKESMKLSRKMQFQVESKIRHALATSQPLKIPRPSIAKIQPKAVEDGDDGTDTDHSQVTL
jgi:hypothetical protein